MVTPATEFVQLGFNPHQSFLSKAAAIRKHSHSKEAGDYAWHAIDTAIADMIATVDAEQAAADEKFATCEMQLKQHHGEENKLKASKIKNELEKAAAEKLIKNMEDEIKKSKTEISDSTKEIKDTTE